MDAIKLTLNDADVISMNEISGNIILPRNVFPEMVVQTQPVKIHFNEDNDGIFHLYNVLSINDAEDTVELAWEKQIDNTLNEAPMTDEERAAKEAEKQQKKFDKGQAKAQKKQDKQDVKDMKTAQKLVKRDMYPEFKNCLFYLQNPDGTFQDAKTQDEARAYYDKISPAIVNAVVATKNDYFVRRGLQDLDERGIKMTEDNMEVPATYAIRWPADAVKEYEDKKKKEAAAAKRKEARSAKKAAEKGKSKSEETPKGEETPAEDKKPSDPYAAQNKGVTKPIIDKFRKIAMATGLEVIDAFNKPVDMNSAASVGKITPETLVDYHVKIKGKEFALTDWLVHAVKNKVITESCEVKNIMLEDLLFESPVITMDDEDMFDPSEFSVKNLIKKAETKEAEKIARMSREAAEAELKKIYDVVMPKFNNSIKRGDSSVKTLEVLFDDLVPESGPAASVAGELVRAIMRILFRDFNDGDKFFEGYGIETCASSAEYLFDNGFAEEIQNILDNAYYLEDDARYTDAINNLAEKVVNKIKNDNSLIYTVNETDSRDYSVDYIKEHQPTYDIEINGSDDIVNLVENGALNAWDLNDYVEHVLSYENYFDGAVVDRPWSHNSTNVSVSNLTRDGYDELENRIQNNLDGFWADLVAEHADELTDDYDDNYEEEEQDDE